MPLEIRLLGGFEVVRDGRAVSGFRTLKARALLVYLALHGGRPLSRAMLAGLLWPEQTTERATHSLRQALTFLRQALDPAPLLVTRDEVRFEPSEDQSVDVIVFERDLETGALVALDAATRLYRGALLEGFFVDDAPEFETWLVAEREHLHAKALAALDRLAEYHLARGDYAATREYLLRALALDPWHETAHRGLMRALALGGQPAAALAQYEKCRRVLDEGLGVEPLEATQILYRQILSGELLPDASASQLTARPQPRFVGRETEHARLANALATIHTKGPPVTLFVEGEVGAGKTRLVDEFARYAVSQGAVVLAGRCFEFGESVAYQPLVDAMRQVMSHNMSLLARGLSPTWLAELSRLLPELRDLEPDLPLPSTEPGDDARRRLFEAVARFFKSILANRRSAVVFIDDLHWADAATLDLLHYVIRQSVNNPLLFIGTYRREEIGGEHPLTVLRRGLSRDHISDAIVLKPLSPEALQIIAENLVEGEAASFARYLYHESEGNPFVMTETLNALFEAGALQASSGERWRFVADAGTPTVTASLQDTILSRVDRLPEPTRALLQFAAVIGRGFDVSLLRQAAGEAAQTAVEMWLERRLVKPASAASFDFVHDKIREVVYRQLSEARRSYLHGEVGAVLQRQHSANLGPLAATLAHHFSRSPHPQQALPHLLMAAQQAERALVFVSVMRLCSQAPDLDPESLEQRFEFLRLRQRAHEFLSVAEADSADAEAMLAVAEQLGDARRVAWALQRLALSYAYTGQAGNARPAIERALALHREAGDTSGEIEALMKMALFVRDVDGDPRRAFELFDEGCRLARSIGSASAEAFCLGELAILRAERGEYAAAVETYRTCLGLLREVGERSAEAGYLNPLASLCRALGQYQLAAEALAEALRLSLEMEHTAIQGWTRLNLGRLALWQGSLAQARESFELAQALAIEHRLRLIEAHAHLGLGQTCLAEGDFGAARERLLRALELFADIDTGMMVVARAYLSQALLGQGELEAAEQYSTAAMGAVEAGLGTFLEVQQIYRCHARVLRAVGKAVQAARCLENGRAIVLAQADGLSAAWRKTYLEEVEINREIMAGG